MHSSVFQELVKLIATSGNQTKREKEKKKPYEATLLSAIASTSVSVIFMRRFFFFMLQENKIYSFLLTRNFGVLHFNLSNSFTNYNFSKNYTSELEEKV